MKIFGKTLAPTEAERWASTIAELEARSGEVNGRFEANEARRRELALASVTGDTEAEREVRDLEREAEPLAADLRRLGDALAEARRKLAAVQAVEREAAERKERVALKKLLVQRLALAEAVEDRLRDLARDLNKMADLAGPIEQKHRALGGPETIARPFAAVSVSSRLSEFCFGLGMAPWFQVECSTMKTPPNSFLALEEQAQAPYDPDPAPPPAAAA